MTMQPFSVWWWILRGYSILSWPAEGKPSWLRRRNSRSAALSLPEAALKWLLLVLVGLIDCAWLAYAGFRIDFGIARSVGVISFLLVIGIFYAGRDERLMDFGLFGAQYLSLFAVMIPISYLAASTNAPLVDGTFDAIDKAMGLDWVAWTQWVLVHPALRQILAIAYESLTIQALFCYMYNIHARANSRNNEIWWTTFVSALATIGIGALIPAISAWVYYGLVSMRDFPHMQQFAALRAGTMHVVSFSDPQGLVQFPSFHTILAIILTYNLRHNRCLFSLAVALNAALIFACPTEGGHYFIDLAGGAGVAAATICGFRAVQRRFDARPPPPSSYTAASSDDAFDRERAAGVGIRQ